LQEIELCFDSLLDFILYRSHFATPIPIDGLGLYAYRTKVAVSDRVVELKERIAPYVKLQAKREKINPRLPVSIL